MRFVCSSPCCIRAVWRLAESCSSTEQTPGGAAAETRRGGPAEHCLRPLRPGHGGELHHTVTQNPQKQNCTTLRETELQSEPEGPEWELTQPEDPKLISKLLTRTRNTWTCQSHHQVQKTDKAKSRRTYRGPGRTRTPTFRKEKTLMRTSRTCGTPSETWLHNFYFYFLFFPSSRRANKANANNATLLFLYRVLYIAIFLTSLGSLCSGNGIVI